MTKTLTTMVWVRSQFVGFHRWKDAPDEVAFLRDWHRHIFYVRMGVQVCGLNREQEFFTLKGKLDLYLNSVFVNHGSLKNNRFEYSCEQIAHMIQKTFDAMLVEVSEDGENGATVFAETIYAKQPTDLV